MRIAPILQIDRCYERRRSGFQSVGKANDLPAHPAMERLEAPVLARAEILRQGHVAQIGQGP
jgi:hypothetical protein